MYPPPRLFPTDERRGIAPAPAAAEGRAERMRDPARATPKRRGRRAAAPADASAAAARRALRAAVATIARGASERAAGCADDADDDADVTSRSSPRRDGRTRTKKKVRQQAEKMPIARHARRFPTRAS